MGLSDKFKDFIDARKDLIVVDEILRNENQSNLANLYVYGALKCFVRGGIIGGIIATSHYFISKDAHPNEIPTIAIIGGCVDSIQYGLRGMCKLARFFKES